MKHTLLALLIVFSSFCHAQDPHFSQFSSGWSNTNPALTAFDGSAAAQTAYRNQWPSLSSNYITSNTSLAYYDSLLNTSFGLNFEYDVAGAFSHRKLNFNFGVPIRLGEHSVFKPGLEFGYLQQELDWNQLTFGDQIDPRRGFVYTTGDSPRGGVSSAVDFAAGLVFYRKGLHVGVAMYHLTEPNVSVIQGNSRLPRRLSIHASQRLILQRGSDSTAVMTIEPYVHYQQQADFSNLRLGMLWQYHAVQLGVGYRNKDALLFMGGVRFQQFGAMYSYDLTVNQLTSEATGGAHELSFRYFFLRDKPRHENFVPMLTSLF